MKPVDLVVGKDLPKGREYFRKVVRFMIALQLPGSLYGDSDFWYLAEEAYIKATEKRPDGPRQDYDELVLVVYDKKLSEEEGYPTFRVYLVTHTWGAIDLGLYVDSVTPPKVSLQDHPLWVHYHKYIEYGSINGHANARAAMEAYLGHGKAKAFLLPERLLHACIVRGRKPVMEIKALQVEESIPSWVDYILQFIETRLGEPEGSTHHLREPLEKAIRKMCEEHDDPSIYLYTSFDPALLGQWPVKLIDPIIGRTSDVDDTWPVSDPTFTIGEYTLRFNR